MSSCTFIFDDSVTQCDVDGDCQRRFADSVCNLATNTCEVKPIDPIWGCLDIDDELDLEAKSPEIVNLRLEVVNAISRQPVAGAKVRACGRLDPPCKDPLVPDTPVDAAGIATLAVPKNFNGYFELRGPDAATTPYIPELLYLPAREIARGGGRRALLFTATDGDNLVKLVGGSFALDVIPNAVLIATALTCQGESSAGISFEPTSESSITGESKQFYTDSNNLPRTAAAETSDSGTFALTNLNTTAAVTIQATINPLQRPMGADAAAVVRDNWLTVIYVAP